jgi:molybdenum cofactor cytidylyltransferase
VSDVAALVLAAGQGSRFGPRLKLLAPLDGKPLVRHVVEAALASSADPVLVVVGHRAEEVEAALVDLPVTFVRNPHYAEGLSTSLRAGLDRCPAAADAAIVLLGDMPLVGPALIDRLIGAWDRKASAVVPTFEGRRGNPVLLSLALAPALRALAGDAGAGPVLRMRSDVLELPVADRSVLMDVDTADALSGMRT